MKRIIAIVLSLLLLLGTFTACGSGGASASPKSSAASAPAPTAAAESAPAPEPETQPEAPAGLYPVAEETVDLDLLLNVGGFIFAFIPDGDLNLTRAVQAQEAATNVHVNFQCIEQDVYMDQFTIMIASDDLPDMIGQPEDFYSGGIEKVVADGVVVNIRDYLDCAPDYAKFLDEHKGYAKVISSDTGKIASVWGYTEINGAGGIIRGDLLDDMGAKIPQTYDELHDILLAFKTDYELEYPLYIYGSGFTGCPGGWLSGGYGISEIDDNTMGVGWQIAPDGKTVEASCVLDGMKEYLTMLNTWYNEGIISPNFLSIADKFAVSTDILAGKVGFTATVARGLSDAERAQSGIEGFKMVPMADVTKAPGEKIGYGLGGNYGCKGNGSIGVSASSEYIEEAVKYLNWFWTEEGVTACNYGIENETFVYDGDGNVQFTDIVTNNPNGLLPVLALSIEISWAAMPFMQTVERTLLTYGNDDEKQAYNIWTSNRDESLVYNGSLTEEEALVFNNKNGDVYTYVAENISAFIINERSLDEWDEYVAQVYDIGLQELTDLKQAAYDRFLVR